MSTPKPFSRLTEVKDTAELIGSFLYAQELGRLLQASKKSQILFSKQLTEKKLLKAVFEADPKLVKEILAKQNSKSKCLVLSRTHCKETFDSQKTGKSIYKRVWRNISPLEAAAWCGDNFLVKLLLNYIPKSLLSEAAKQLQGILERTKSQENGEYLVPYYVMIEAYQQFTNEEFFLSFNRDWKKIDELWNMVWERQKKLPKYGLQEFCDKKFHKKDLTKEPKRSCLYYDDSHVDLDDMPFGKALCVCVEGIVSGGKKDIGGWGIGSVANHDSKAFQDLITYRKIELGKIIKELNLAQVLEEPDSSETESRFEDLGPPNKKQRV